MNLFLFFLGLAKVAFGGVVAAVAIVVAYRVLARLLGTERGAGPHDVADGVLQAAGLLSLGLLVRHAVEATFAAVDVTLRTPPLSAGALGQLALAALLHLGLTLAVGVGVLALGVAVFNRMTPQVDEVEEVRRGHVAPALVLGAILVVTALLTAPGLSAALDGLIPFPHLAPGVLPEPW